MKEIFIDENKNQIPLFTAAAIVAVFLCFLNMVYFLYLFDGIKEAQSPILLGACVFVGTYLLILSSLLLLGINRAFKPASIIFVAVACISSYFMKNYGILIDQNMLSNVVSTDTREAFSYLNLKLILWILLLGVLPCFLIYKMKIKYIKTIKKNLIFHLGGGFGSIALVAIILALNSQSMVPFFRNYNIANKLALPYAPIYYSFRFAKSELLPKEPFKKIAEDAAILVDSIESSSLNPQEAQKARLLVFVLGETARAQNYSALGYTKNATNSYTKPLLEAQNGAFWAANSCGTATKISLPCMFSSLPISKWRSDENAENALDVLAKVGTKVIWLGNNTGGCYGICKRIEWEYVEYKFDGEILKDLRKRLDDFAQNPQNTAIILHLQGSHGPTYFERYPNEEGEFKVAFKPTCDTSDLAKCEIDALVNTYDNTIAYTDYIISEIFKMLQSLNGADSIESSKKDSIALDSIQKDSIESSAANSKIAPNSFESVILYISDHGESLGENGIFLHAMPLSLAPPFQTLVPFAIFSPNANLITNAKARFSGTLSQDFIFHTLLGFFNIRAQIYQKELDLFAF